MKIILTALNYHIVKYTFNRSLRGKIPDLNLSEQPEELVSGPSSPRVHWNPKIIISVTHVQEHTIKVVGVGMGDWSSDPLV